MNQTYIDTYLGAETFNFAFINNMFDLEDYVEPIQRYLDDQLFF